MVGKGKINGDLTFQVQVAKRITLSTNFVHLEEIFPQLPFISHTLHDHTYVLRFYSLIILQYILLCLYIRAPFHRVTPFLITTYDLGGDFFPGENKMLRISYIGCQ